MKSAVTNLIKLQIAQVVKNNVFSTLANTYVGIGRPLRWGDEIDPETTDEIEDIVYTTNYNNQVWRDMIAMKKIATADIQLVIPRVDWSSGTSYDPYSDELPMFTHESKLSLGLVDATGNTVTANGAVFTGNIATGNIVTIGSEAVEVIAIPDANTLILNTALSSVYSNTSAIRISNTYPQFANNFYCRNTKDQVFKCLHNPGVVSTVEPTIDIDGQLPENPWVETGDEYKWKYLYTIPYGLKRTFFTRNWMPVLNDATVVAGSENGRIDIINISDSGSGYYLDGQSGNSTSLPIITITGDGSGAEVTAHVSSGEIIELNILDGGSGYTTAEVVVTDQYQLSNGTPAVFEVSIAPAGGHGSNPSKELGCFSLMTSVALEGNESDTIPVGDGVTPFDFRQITLIRDPILANGTYASGSVYRTSTKVTVTDPGITNYTNDEVVYIGTDIVGASMTATVVTWEPNTNDLYINNISGNVAVGATMTGESSGATAVVLGIDESQINLFTGDLLYIENRNKIVRNVDQTEQIRLVLSF